MFPFILIVNPIFALLKLLPAAAIFDDALVAVDCDPKVLQQNSIFQGKGGNAYVLRLTGTACHGAKGEVLKAFQTEKLRNEALDILAALPNFEELVGLACAAKSKDVCKVDSKCVNNQNTLGFDEKGQDCFFLRMKDGGSKTVEECFMGQTFSAKQVKYLLSQAMTILQKIHTADYYHRDFQLKNLMTDATCKSGSLKVIDLDSMTRHADDPENAPKRIMLDYADLFGVCGDVGGKGQSISTLYKGPHKKQVEDFETKAKSALCPAQGAVDPATVNLKSAKTKWANDLKNALRR